VTFAYLNSSPARPYLSRYNRGMDIRASRLAAGLTQSELARRAGVSQPNLSAYEHGRRTPSPLVLDRIRRALQRRPSEVLAEHLDEVRALIKRHNATDPRIFGSVARGSDRENSDLDLMVTYGPQASLFDEIALRLELEELLGVKVDVVASDATVGRVPRSARRDAVPL